MRKTDIVYANRLPGGLRALPNFIYLSMLRIENIIGKGRRPSVEVLVETETSAMETLPSRWTNVRDDNAKKETNKTGIKNLVSLTENSISALFCIPNSDCIRDGVENGFISHGGLQPLPWPLEMQR